MHALKARAVRHGRSAEAEHRAILPIDADVAQLWGYLRAPRPENALDKLIAATALVHDLVVATRNPRDFAGKGVRLLNPFD